MLRKRSRAVSSKPSLMPDSTTTTTSIPSPTSKYNKLTPSSLFPSPRIFVGFSPKSSSDSETAMSPTSILETKPFSSTANPFFTDKNPRKPLLDTTLPTTYASESRQHHPWDNGDSGAIGLAIVDAISNEQADSKASKPESRMVLFGSQLKIQIPTNCSNSISSMMSVEFPNSPIEFGIKTKESQLAMYSPARRSPLGSANVGSEVMMASSPWVITGWLSPREMEQSEDYTCVISHGPNPRTTHIFDNCIVESRGDGFIASTKDNRFSPPERSVYSSDDFLSFCHACNKNLEQGKDIFIYRGEKAFCSQECRCQEMLSDEERMEEC